MNRSRCKSFRSALATALLLAAAQAGAQSYPAKTITVIVPLAPGGPVDTEARLYTAKLTEQTGKSFVVDYKVGAGGSVGISYVAKAPADGYTLLMGSSNFTITPAVNKNLDYDIIRDFAPVSLMSKKPSVLMMSPALPVKSLQELIAYARANPDKVNFGTTGAGGATELAGRFLASVSNMPLTFIHYKGTGPLTTDLVAGRVHLAVTNVISGMPLAKAGKVRILGVTTLTRQPHLPDLPTLTESGAPGYEYVGWAGFLAPARTPAAVVDWLSAEMAKVAKAEDVIKKFAVGDIDFVGSNPEYMRKFIAAEFARWQKVVKDAGIKPEE